MGKLVSKISISILAVILFISCGKEQQKFLDGEYLPKAAVLFTITAPSIIQVGSEFDITLEAKGGTTGTLISWYEGIVNCNAIGAGTLSLISQSGFKGGRETVTLKYENSALPAGGEEVIVIKCADSANAGYNGTSSTIKALAAPYMTGFKITVPTSVYIDQPFNITISAEGNNGSVITSYNGTVTLSSAGGLGSLSVTTATLVNGTVTISASYSATAQYLTISATDGTYSGTSNTFSAGMGAGGNFSINSVAVPLSATSVRLSWNPIPGATAQNLYKKDGSGVYNLIATPPTSTSYYLDSGLTTGTNYEYKIEILNGGSVAGTGYASATPKACTNKSGTIGSETWTATGGPYCVTANITVDNGTLLIQSGAVVLFSAGTGITVQNSTGPAQINIEGSSSSLVVLTSASATPAAGDWTGISFAATATGTTFDASNLYVSGSRLLFAVLEYASNAVTSNVPLDIEYILFRYNKSSTSGGSAFNGTLGTSQISVVRYSGFYQNEVIDANGGAVYAAGTSTSGLILEKSTFSANTASDTGATADGFGAAVYTNALKPMISDNYFYGNSAVDGGAIYQYDGDNGTIARNTIDKNQASGNGGSMAFRAVTSIQNMTIEENTITNSTAGNHGGSIYVYAYNGAGGNTYFSGNTFEKNTVTTSAATNNGGALYLEANFTCGGCSGGDKVRMENNSFRENTISSSNSANGAVMYWKNSSNRGILNSNTIDNNIFQNATATSNASGIYVYSNGGSFSSNIITKNLFEQLSTPGDGGGIYIYSRYSAGSATVSSNQIKQNSFKNLSAARGGGIYMIAGDQGSQTTNNVISQNYFYNVAATSQGAAFYVGGIGYSGYFNSNTISYNIADTLSATNGGFAYIETSYWSTGSFLPQANDNTFSYNTIQNVTVTGSGALAYQYRQTFSNAQDQNSYLNNFMSNLTAGSGTILYHTGLGITNTNIQHNSFAGTNLFVLNSDTTTFSSNYWGGASPASTCGASTGLCLPASGAGSAATITTPATSAWPTCLASPSDPDCVGAHDLCTNAPGDSLCVGRP